MSCFNVFLKLLHTNNTKTQHNHINANFKNYASVRARYVRVWMCVRAIVHTLCTGSCMHIVCRIKEKVMSYIELAPLVGNAQSALVTESTGRLIHFNTDLSGKYLYTLHLFRDDVYVYPSLSIAR